MSAFSPRKFWALRHLQSQLFAAQNVEVQVVHGLTGSLTAVVQKIDPKTGNAILTIGNSEATLPKLEQVPDEVLSEGDHIKVYVVDVKEGEKGAFSYKHTQSDAVVNCDMSYLYSSNNSIDVTVSCAGKEDGKGYVIDFVTNLQAPLIFKNGKLSEGEIDITYKDSSNSVIHAFTTEVVGAASSPYRIDDIVIYK